ncbi:MAG: hypothetical protein QM658_02940 [Gordonia sp. (in: high G+C Gram-positive bacteria)]
MTVGLVPAEHGHGIIAQSLILGHPPPRRSLLSQRIGRFGRSAMFTTETTSHQRAPRRRTVRVKALFASCGVAAALSLGTLVCGEASAQPDDPPAPLMSCADIARLVAQGHPGDANAAIARRAEARVQPDCAKEKADADKNIGKAKELIAYASSRPSESDIKTKVADARKLDASVDVPDTLAQRIGDTPQLKTETAWWNTFRNDVLSPLGTFLADGLAMLLIAVVLARLLLLSPLNDVSGPLSGLAAATRARPFVVSVALVLSALLLAAPLLLSLPHLDGWLSFGILVPWVAITAILVSLTMSTRRRISIAAHTSDDKESGALAAAVITSLRELGAEPAKGLEIPLGTDVKALDGSDISDLAPGYLAKLVNMATSILGITPWRVTIDTVEESSDTVNSHVLITRNGRSVGSARITPGERAPNSCGKSISTETLAAAAVLCTIAKDDPKVSRGLAGATDWRSLAWTYAAAQMKGGDNAFARRRILFAAVLRDHNNLLAQAALKFELYRSSQDPGELLRYSHWLTNAAQSRLLASPPLEVQRVRMLHSALAVTLNRLVVLSRVAAPPTNPDGYDPQELWSKVDSDAKALRRHPEFTEAIGPTLDALKGIAEDVKALFPDAEFAAVPEQGSGDVVLESPRAAYDEACEKYRTNNIVGAMPKLAMWIMGDSESLVECASVDPFLAGLTSTPEFKLPWRSGIRQRCAPNSSRSCRSRRSRMD